MRREDKVRHEAAIEAYVPTYLDPTWEEPEPTRWDYYSEAYASELRALDMEAASEAAADAEDALYRGTVKALVLYRLARRGVVIAPVAPPAAPVGDDDLPF